MLAINDKTASTSHQVVELGRNAHNISRIEYNVSRRELKVHKNNELFTHVRCTPVVYESMMCSSDIAKYCQFIIEQELKNIDDGTAYRVSYAPLTISKARNILSESMGNTPFYPTNINIDHINHNHEGWVFITKTNTSIVISPTDPNGNHISPSDHNFKHTLFDAIKKTSEDSGYTIIVKSKSSFISYLAYNPYLEICTIITDKMDYFSRSCDAKTIVSYIDADSKGRFYHSELKNNTIDEAELINKSQIGISVEELLFE